MSVSRFIVAALTSVWCAACSRHDAPRIPIRPAEPPMTVRHPEPAPPASGSMRLSFLGLNDLHGRLRALPAFAGYANNLREARARDGGAVALVDAGDMFQGTLESNLNEGAAVISAYRTLGMAVAVLGNHEFDFGPPGEGSGGDPQGAIRARIAEASFPILAANLIEQSSGELPRWNKLRDAVIIPIGGVPVGFVGVLTAETRSIVMSTWFAGLDVTPLAPTVLKQAERLRQSGAKLVVVLAHAGADCKDFSIPAELDSCSKDAEVFDLARALPRGTVDAIFAGHTHAGVAQIVNGVPIVEAYARGRAFSRIDFDLDRNTQRVLDSKIFPPHELCPALPEGGGCVLRDYEGQPTSEDPRLVRAIAPALAQAEQRRETPLGCVVSEAMACTHGSESALGNLFADLLREAVPGADVAIINGGSLRADLPAGELNYGELFEAMPFDNLVARLRISGAELKQVISTHLQHDAHGLISLSGVRVKAHCGPHGLDFKLLHEDGRVVSDNETLLVATSDYLATGGDSLFAPLALPRARIQIDTSASFRDALVQSLQRHPRLSPHDPEIFDPAHPRLALSGPRPLVCPH